MLLISGNSSNCTQQGVRSLGDLWYISPHQAGRVHVTSYCQFFKKSFPVDNDSGTKGGLKEGCTCKYNKMSVYVMAGKQRLIFICILDPVQKILLDYICIYLKILTVNSN